MYYTCKLTNPIGKCIIHVSWPSKIHIQKKVLIFISNLHIKESTVIGVEKSDDLIGVPLLSEIPSPNINIFNLINDHIAS